MACYGGNNTSGPIDVSTAVRAHYDFESETFIATTLRARDGSKGVDSDCTDTLVPVAFRSEMGGNDGGVYQDGTTSTVTTAPPAVAFQSSQSGVRLHETHATLDANNGPRRHNGALQDMRVRRLTPRECERLQGFPDDHTLVPHRGKPAADGPRYKAIGNSMAVPVMAWIGNRIKNLENSL